MIRRDPHNDARIAWYYRVSAGLRAMNPCEFKRRYVRGLAIQRDLYRTKPQSPYATATVVPFRLPSAAVAVAPIHMEPTK
ncbi:MAG: hypothetical protein JST65_16160 [Acidobacteria bacterium]|nr:hypothetical protein [Acidobacteriota bacterium]